jgi:hypothetical protein
MITRLTHLFKTLSTNWTTDPAARGAAKMAAGAILVVEGLFGTIRTAGTRGSGGLVGGVVGVVVGLTFVGLGQWMTPGLEDGISIDGRIADVREGVSEGRASYSAVYAYTVGAEEFQFISPTSSSSRPRIGEVVKIVYSASEPRNAYRADGVDGNFHKAFIGIGGFIAVLAFFSLLVSLALLVGGIWLFQTGRAERRASGTTNGLLADLRTFIPRARSGELGSPDAGSGMAAGPSGSTAL